MQLVDLLMARGGVYAGLMAEQARESSDSSAADSFATPARAETVAMPRRAID